jgi:hypothetical protein
MPRSKTTKYVIFLQDNKLLWHHMYMYRAETGHVIVCLIIS